MTRRTDLAASDAVLRSCPLEKCYRDVLTICAHGAVQDKHDERLGRALLGHPADLTVGVF